MSGDGYCACGELPDNCRCYTVRTGDGRTRTTTLPTPPDQPKRR